MSLHDTYENLILDAFLGSGHASTFPSTVNVALFTTMPGEDGTGSVEPAGGSYARVTVNNDSTQWPDAAASVKTNGTDITFPTATATWGTVVGVGLLDPSNANAVMWSGLLAEQVTVLNGEVKKFVAGTLVVVAD